MRKTILSRGYFYKWFAWYPVQIDIYDKRSQKIGFTVVWLEYIERKVEQDSFWCYKFRYYRFGPDRERSKSGVE